MAADSISDVGSSSLYQSLLTELLGPDKLPMAPLVHKLLLLESQFNSTEC